MQQDRVVSVQLVDVNSYRNPLPILGIPTVLSDLVG
jgi:hypothetical protein